MTLALPDPQVRDFAGIQRNFDALKKISVGSEFPPTPEQYGGSVQAALNAAGAFGSVMLPKMYMEDVTVPYEGMTIFGLGLDTGIKAQTATALSILGKRYTALRDMVIDGDERTKDGVLLNALSVTGTVQSTDLDRVRFYRCVNGLRIGPGTGGINQADKTTLIAPQFIECAVGLYNQSPNGQQTVLINPNFSSSYDTSILLEGGSLDIIGGQIQGGTGSYGIRCAGFNIDAVRLQDFIFEGPIYDFYENVGEAWPRDGVIAENVVFQGSSGNVICNSHSARFTARHSRFNASNAVLGNGMISFNQTGGRVDLQACEYAAPSFAGTNPPMVVYDAPRSAVVASASTLPITRNWPTLFIVSGTTNIDNITPVLPQGYEITLLFQSALTVVNRSGGTGNLRLGEAGTGGNYVVNSGSTLALVSDGTNWCQTGGKKII